eukprot:11184-Heterococcus_DN1.PRE.2
MQQSRCTSAVAVLLSHNVSQHVRSAAVRLDHPSVARLQEVYHSPDYVFMVMDIYEGTIWSSRIYDYRFTAVYTRSPRCHTVAVDMLTAAASGSVMRTCTVKQRRRHRDLKLENILYEHKGPDAGIKIVDFGLGTASSEASLMRDIVGTWIYMSPEVLKGKHSPFAVDM